jgi:FkbH-like protein
MQGLLRHLPEPPQDFRKHCREVTVEADLFRLASFQLESTQLEQLARAHARIKDARLKTDATTVAPLSPPFRLGVLCNATTDFLPSAFSATGLRYGMNVDVFMGDYGQIIQDASDPQSRINQQRCDAVLLALDYRGLQLEMSPGSGDQNPVQNAIDLLAQTRDALKTHHQTTVIFQTVSAPAMPLFGGMDSVIGRNTRAVIQDFNMALRQFVKDSPGDLLLDVEMLANTIGLQQWHSLQQWNVAKLQFSQQALPVYADNLMRMVAALRGKSRKCLVLDLDNTCWGGAVGDLGMDGILLGQGSAMGEAFIEVQRTALRLRERGIILAVCSKNNYEAAIQPFREHPEMLLKEEHISVFQANWIDKASNLEEIAKTLNIGIDSLVLLDDNPAERIQVRESLPSVAVPELPDDPSLYPSILLNAGYFETVSFTSEDSQRVDQYRANAVRSQLEASARDPHAFLSALDMTISFAPFDKLNRTRIVQLINKTNQFNLTTRRYTEAEVTAMENDSSIWTMQVRLADRFGDNGMISCIIVRQTSASVWEIDTWLMSCRVLSRRVEECSMAQLVKRAAQRGISTIIGRYSPTAKNDMVRDFYKKRGFTLIEDTAEGSVWTRDVASYEADEFPMVIDEQAMV